MSLARYDYARTAAVLDGFRDGCNAYRPGRSMRGQKRRCAKGYPAADRHLYIRAFKMAWQKMSAR